MESRSNLLTDLTFIQQANESIIDMNNVNTALTTKTEEENGRKLSSNHSNPGLLKSVSNLTKSQSYYQNELYNLYNNVSDTIDFTKAELGDTGLNVICNGLLNNKRLRTLKLTRNNLTDEQIVKLLKSLRNNHTLEYLSLSNNLLTVATLDLFLNFFKSYHRTTRIKKINLIENKQIVTKRLLPKLALFQKYEIEIVTS